MPNRLNKELASRSLELEALAAMCPDDRIARIVWDRVQDDLEHRDDLVYGMQFCISNISALIGKEFRQNVHTLSAVQSCRRLISLLGWDVDKVLAMEQSQKVFVDYIKDVVSMYDDTKQDHCENAQCILAMNMNYMLLGDLEYVMNKSPDRQKHLRPALEGVVMLRKQMILVFDWDSHDI